MGIGALYELRAPSIITHYALRITHYFLENKLTHNYYLFYHFLSIPKRAEGENIYFSFGSFSFHAKRQKNNSFF